MSILVSIEKIWAYQSVDSTMLINCVSNNIFLLCTVHLQQNLEMFKLEYCKLIRLQINEFSLKALDSRKWHFDFRRFIKLIRVSIFSPWSSTLSVTQWRCVSERIFKARWFLYNSSSFICHLRDTRYSSQNVPWDACIELCSIHTWKGYSCLISNRSTELHACMQNLKDGDFYCKLF